MKLSYDAKSPITGNFKVLIEFDDTYGETHTCMESGYQYMQGYDVDSERCADYESKCPKFITDTKFIDGNRVWYKSIVISGDTVLYPTQTGWDVGKFMKEYETSFVTMMKDGVLYGLQSITEHKFTQNQFEDALYEFYKVLSENDNED